MARLEWVEDEPAFDGLREQWERLADLHASPFVRHAWLRAWWDAFGTGRRLRICTAWEGDELTGAFPLCARRSRLEALANAHTPLNGVLARDDETLRALVAEVLRSRAEAVSVPALAGVDPALGVVDVQARRTHAFVLVERHLTSPVVETNGDWPAYRRRLSRSTRKDTERRRRKLELEQDARFAVVARPDDLDAALDEGFALEASGWKKRRGTAILSSPETATFYRSAAHAFAAEGRLALSSISVGGRMIVFDYCLLDHGRLWSLKVGYDEAFRRYAPGIVLTLAEIERCFELGLAAFELLGGEELWKRKFATTVRPQWNVHAYRARPAALTHYVYRRSLRPRLRSAYRRFARP